jgi:hypothetical protein
MVRGFEKDVFKRFAISFFFGSYEDDRKLIGFVAKTASVSRHTTANNGTGPSKHL